MTKNTRFDLLWDALGMNAGIVKDKETIQGVATANQ